MSFFAGLAGGISEGAIRTQQENARAQEAATRRESEILSALATSDNASPEIKYQAVAGLLELAHPSKKKKGGRGGVLGEYEQSPYLPMLQQMISRNVGGPGAVQQAQRPAGPPGGGTASPGSAAMPAHAATDPGAPPLRTLPAMPTTGGSMAALSGGPPERPQEMTSPSMANFSSGVDLPASDQPGAGASQPPPQRTALPQRQFGPLASPSDAVYHRQQAEGQGVYETVLQATGDPAQAEQAMIAALAGRYGLPQQQQGIPAHMQKVSNAVDMNGNPVEGAYFDPNSGKYYDGDGRWRPDVRERNTTLINPTNARNWGATTLGFPLTGRTPDQEARITLHLQDTAVQEQYRKAQGRGTAANETLLNRPIGMDQGAVQQVPGTTPLGATAGLVPGTPDMQKRTIGAKETLGQLDAYAALIQRVVPDRQGFLARHQGSVENLLASYQGNPDYATLLTMRLELQNAIARSRDVGNLSQFEQEAADRVIGEINQGLTTGTDTQEVLLAKLAAVRTRIERAVKINAPLQPAGGGAPQAGGLARPAAPGINANIANDPASPRGPWTFRGQQVTWGQPVTYAGTQMYIIGVKPDGTLRLTDQPPPQ